MCVLFLHIRPKVAREAKNCDVDVTQTRYDVFRLEFKNNAFVAILLFTFCVEIERTAQICTLHINSSQGVPGRACKFRKCDYALCRCTNLTRTRNHTNAKIVLLVDDQLCMQVAPLPPPPPPPPLALLVNCGDTDMQMHMDIHETDADAGAGDLDGNIESFLWTT